MGQIQTILIVMFLFIGFLVGVSSFYGEMFTNYGNPNATDLASLNSSQELRDTLSNMRNTSQQVEEGDIWGGLTTGAMNTLTLIFGVIPMITNLVADFIFLTPVITGEIPIELIIGGILAVVVIFAFLYAILKVKL